MLLTFLFWYMMIGVCFGFMTCYMVLKVVGSWQAFCDEFNAIETKFDREDSFKLTPEVAAWLIPFVFMLMGAFVWMPFLTYLGSKK